MRHDLGRRQIPARHRAVAEVDPRRDHQPVVGELLAVGQPQAVVLRVDSGDLDARDLAAGTVDAWIAENPNRAIEREFAADEQWAYAEQWD